MKQRLFKILAKTLSSSFVPRFLRLITLLLVLSIAEVSNAAVIDVTQYGAVPNDSVDDSLAIQNAIDSAPDQSTIYFPKGIDLVAGYDRFSWVFGRGTVPNEDILINDNLVEDLQIEVDFGLRVRIEGNTIARPVSTAGIGVFTVDDNTAAQDYTINRNMIVDPVVSAAGITVHLDPPSTKYATMKTFRILDNDIVYTKYVSGAHASAIRLGTGNNSQATIGNVFDDIVIQNNRIYKDPEGDYDFGAVNAIIFGNSSATANFGFDNMTVRDNVIYYNSTIAIPNIDIRQKGVNYRESNNPRYAVFSDTMPPSRPTALTAINNSDTRIHLLWNESVDNIGVYRYRIYRNGADITDTTAPYYEDRNLTPGTSYTYAVLRSDIVFIGMASILPTRAEQPTKAWA